ncbi:MAG: PKD domain-containing protein, partial [Myxococcota bacterium]
MDKMVQTSMGRSWLGLVWGGGICVVMALFGCSDDSMGQGGDPAPDDTTNTRPVAQANGPNAPVARGSRVQLDGRESYDIDGDTLTYSWEQIDGPTAVLEGVDTATPTVVTPNVNGELSFILRVWDGREISSPSEVRLTMANQAPVVRVLPMDDLVGKRQEVVLDATGSSDPDGDPLVFTWTQVAGGGEASIVGGLGAEPTMTTPGISGTLAFEVVASDGVASSEPVKVQTQVINAAPVAMLGADLQVFKG